jgi:hypothetical protein
MIETGSAPKVRRGCENELKSIGYLYKKNEPSLEVRASVVGRVVRLLFAVPALASQKDRGPRSSVFLVNAR